MIKKDWNEELSAFLDGEADQPDAVRRALEEDAALCGRADAYRKMGDGLKALPKPDVHPAFATRIMAAIEEAEPAPRRSLRWFWAAGCAAAALVALALLLRTAPTTEPSGIQLTESSPATAEPLSDDSSVLNEMALRLESGEDLALFEDEAAGTSPDLDPNWLDTLYDEVYASLETYDDAPLGQEDFLVTLETLDAPERETLDALLRSYLEEV